MNPRNTFAISFYLRADKLDAEKTAPIFMRITVNGQREDISINRRVNVDYWLDGKVVGKTNDCKQLSQFMDSLKSKIFSIQRDLLDRHELITADIIKKNYLGNGKNTKTIVQVFKHHNDQMKLLIDKDYAFRTWQRYETTLKHLIEFLAYQYKMPDMFLYEMKFDFITNFELYLKTVRECGHNSAVKYITNFRKIVTSSVHNEWIEKDPFSAYKKHLKEVDRGFLDEGELRKIEEKEIAITRLDLVRDIFVFSCYSGLAYAEVAKLSDKHIITGVDGEKWIHICRTKTEVKSIIPILPKALNLMEKYNSYSERTKGDLLFPILSNQKMNAYLKELGDICGIEKNLTYHLARHTFATTVTLTNGVPMESVSAMLGHKNMRTTQIYSKVVVIGK